ncbi:D-alanyl-D-alanine carboxypeptidase family protein [Candidatus Saccharibacteria bacterium]|nr:D-alanyl-D-alanine carboxypeptidase family protein [Candidatus Saccharibacteria bacterium]
MKTLGAHQTSTTNSSVDLPPPATRRTRAITPLRVIAVIIVAFITFVAIRMATLDTSINLVMTYSAPTPVDLSQISADTSAQWAAAINGQIIAKSKDTHVQPSASTIKMLTALAVMDKKPFNPGETGETITITPELYRYYLSYAAINGSVVKVTQGEEISEYDALSAMLIASSNNIADTLAVWAFDSMENYHAYATELAAKLGLKDTVVGSDASGFDTSSTSTPEDLTILASKVLENPVLAEIVGKSSADIPVAGKIENTNKLLGADNIIGVKTGYIGSASGYCLATGYLENTENPSTKNIITAALLGAPTRNDSFTGSDSLVKSLQNTLKPTELVKSDDEVGYLETWWTGKIPLYSKGSTSTILISTLSAELSKDTSINNSDSGQVLQTSLSLGSENSETFSVPVESAPFSSNPTFFERLGKVFGINPKAADSQTNNTDNSDDQGNQDSQNSQDQTEAPSPEQPNEPSSKDSKDDVATPSGPGNCTVNWGPLTLINYHFTVDNNYIANRRGQLTNLTAVYGINELNSYNGTPLLDAEAATHLNDMIKAYESEHQGHEMKTVSCFRSVGTSCGRLCAATGTSEHHSGYACDLIDPAYGTSLDTDTLPQHIEWQWLKENSYKYGFIDRYPEHWAGSSMAQPINVDDNGTTGYYETWHYRYVGQKAATEIATGKYNNGVYDSLEHYLKQTGRLKNLTSGSCE